MNQTALKWNVQCVYMTNVFWCVLKDNEVSFSPASVITYIKYHLQCELFSAFEWCPPHFVHFCTFDRLMHCNIKVSLHPLMYADTVYVRTVFSKSTKNTNLMVCNKKLCIYLSACTVYVVHVHIYTHFCKWIQSQALGPLCPVFALLSLSLMRSARLRSANGFSILSSYCSLHCTRMQCYSLSSSFARQDSKEKQLRTRFYCGVKKWKSFRIMDTNLVPYAHQPEKVNNNNNNNAGKWRVHWVKYKLMQESFNCSTVEAGYSIVCMYVHRPKISLSKNPLFFSSYR